MLLSKDGKLLSILFLESVNEVFIWEFFEAKTEVSFEENAFNKVFFQLTLTILLPKSFQRICRTLRNNFLSSNSFPHVNSHFVILFGSHNLIKLNTFHHCVALLFTNIELTSTWIVVVDH